MKSKRRERITRMSFILNGFLFLLGGWMLIQEQHWIFGTFQAIAALLNLGDQLR